MTESPGTARSALLQIDSSNMQSAHIDEINATLESNVDATASGSENDGRLELVGTIATPELTASMPASAAIFCGLVSSMVESVPCCTFESYQKHL